MTAPGRKLWRAFEVRHESSVKVILRKPRKLIQSTTHINRKNAPADCDATSTFLKTVQINPGSTAEITVIARAISVNV